MEFSNDVERWMGQNNPLFAYSMRDSMSIKKLVSLWSIVSTLSVLPIAITFCVWSDQNRANFNSNMRLEVSQSLL